MSGEFDVIIGNGLLLDGTGAPGRECSIGIRGGRVEAVSESPLPAGKQTRVIDARGRWITPGFIDLHTHYDAELELAPALSESVRHGVTTVILGSCSLSLAVGTPEDLADLFCRVEAVPYRVVRPMLEKKKDWNSHRDYFRHLRALPLGPNVGAFAGHSAIRAYAMGMARSLEARAAPDEEEMARMERALEEALDEGFLGMSVMTLPWDKVGGGRAFRSRPLPSTYARRPEYRRLTRILRGSGRVFQAAPNITTKLDIWFFILESMGLFRRPLKTTVISMMDIRANRVIYRLCGALSRLANLLLRGDFRWQALPDLFDLWADGIDLVVFEEFGAGAAALHLQDAAARAALLNDPDYRRRFKREWTSRFLPRVFHRDFNQSRILDCPEPETIGKSFAEVARERGSDAVDAFLDLAAAHGDKLRWYTVMGNDRAFPLERIVSHPDVLIGFSDAGAHLRNMAHYAFPLRMLRLVREAARRGRPIMSLERAVHRLTGEIGAWLGIDAGRVAEGRRADLVVINPEGLTARLDRPEEAPIPEFGGMRRLVNRSDGAVEAVLINGKSAVLDGEIRPELGRTPGFGRVLGPA